MSFPANLLYIVSHVWKRYSFREAGPIHIYYKPNETRDHRKMGLEGMNMSIYKRYSLLSVICDILHKHYLGLLS